jgi:hypothetical protein
LAREQVVQLIQRAMADEEFRAWLEEDPEAALAEYQLTPVELNALDRATERLLYDMGLAWAVG